MKKVLVAAPISNEFIAFLEGNNYTLIPFESLSTAPKDIHGIITSNKIVLDKNTIDTFFQLKWIARLGSGMEIVDTNYCTQKNILCFSSPVGIANAVAEHCIASLIDIQKNISKSFLQVNNGQWIRDANRGWELEGKIIGIIGLGNTGKAFAHKLSVFNCSIIAYDIDESQTAEHVTNVSLEKLYQEADIISYHVPYNAQTHHYYKPNLLAKPHILINSSRGAIASTADIINGFNNQQLIGAALDVLDFENQFPLDDHHAELLNRLLSFNTLITPHIAGYSFNAVQKMSIELINQLKKHL
jgi:D-3-phosphoglycerate dehydrogenase / 2-oxoglutarate reductase